MNITCLRPDCNVSFEVPKDQKGKKYCSRSCAAKHTNSLRSKDSYRKPEGLCAVCGKVISASRKYCSDGCLRQSPFVNVTRIVTDGEGNKLCSYANCTSARLEYTSLCRTHYNSKMNSYVDSRYHARRDSYVTEWGGACIDCGTTNDLEFDHVDSNSKLLGVAKMFSGYSDEAIRAELDKCVLRCTECHRIKTLKFGDHLRKM